MLICNILFKAKIFNPYFCKLLCYKVKKNYKEEKFAEEKYNVLELASEIVEAKTEENLEAILQKCVKILPTFESKEEKVAFFQSTILEIISEYWEILTGKIPQNKKRKIIIPL